MISSRFTRHSLVTEAHKTLQYYQPTPNISLDATAGNGHDTCFLARHSQKVYAFDIQEIALQACKTRLEKSNLQAKVQLIHDGHQNLNNTLPTHEKLDLAMFNLGYLPHADPTIMTQSKHTLAALQLTQQRLNQNALLSVMVYPGHCGGREEMQAVLQWCQQLNPTNFAIQYIHSLTETNNSPRLIIIQSLQAS